MHGGRKENILTRLRKEMQLHTKIFDSNTYAYVSILIYIDVFVSKSYM